MTSTRPMKRITTLCHGVHSSKLLSSATYGAEANIYRPSTIDDMELSTPQCLLLALLHSLVEGDVMFSVMLADICHQVEMLRSRHYRVWLLEDFSFPRNDIENAMELLTHLVANGTLKLPTHVMAIMTSLATKYRIEGVYLRALSEEGRCALATQLEDAVTNNNPRDIFELESEGADVCGLTQCGDSFLHLAARAGSSASIAALSILHADLEAVNSSNATPLEEAVRCNCASSVKALLMAGANFNKHLAVGETYLHIAAAGFNNEALEALLEGGMNINGKNQRGETPLVLAVKVGNLRGVELLLEKGADLSVLFDLRLKDGDSLVHSVARSGNIKILKLLKDRKIPANVKNDNGLTPLHVACNISVVRMLLRMGVDVNIGDDTGSTPLMMATRNNKPDIVSLLLLYRAEPKIKDNVGRTALHYAAELGCIELVTTLLDVGARVDDLDIKGDTPLFLASNKLEVLQLLVESADLVMRDCYGDGILHREARSGHVQVVKSLIDAGAVLDMTNLFLKTSLHYAAMEGHTGVVKVLVDAGAMVNIQDCEGWIALHHAAQGGYNDVVTELLEAGSMVNLKNKNQDTALHWAAHGGNYEMVSTLLKYGADVAIKKDNNGWTPLMVASSNGSLDVVQLLVDCGAEVNARTACGMTAFKCAKENNHRAVVDYLRSRGGVA
ncbi:putative ankyrin repeat protein RF_0381 [Halyomorpha halys]|uniref:putative ankyrin repeat protein RF_0381 n=1 Tax=Halyomorpha halys TaxID=286706 RepID=UPI0006D4E012|nr:uncharacterized protein LOC106681360 [Halyomorpha halys]